MVQKAYNNNFLNIPDKFFRCCPVGIISHGSINDSILLSTKFQNVSMLLSPHNFNFSFIIYTRARDGCINIQRVQKKLFLI